MNTTTLKNETNKQSYFFCKQDVKRLNDINIKAYDEKEQSYGNELFGKVCYAFNRSNVFRNYRKKFIAIKVDAPKQLDLVSLDVIRLESYCRDNNISIVKTAKGLVFRINKA